MLKTKIKDEDIKKRIREIIKVRGGNASSLARSIYLNSSYFVSMLNSPEKGISATIYKALAKANVNLKANTEFDLSGGHDGAGTAFTEGAKWGRMGGGQRRSPFQRPWL